MGYGEYGNSFKVLNPSGSQKWSFTGYGCVAGDPDYPPCLYLQSQAVMSTDGILYVGSSDGNLKAINPDGTLKWVSPVGSSTPVVSLDGTIYVSNGDTLSAVNPDGSLKDAYATGHSLNTPTILAPDGTLYVVSNEKSTSRLFAFNTYSKGPALSSWPMYQHDAQHTGRLTIPGDLNGDGKVDCTDLTIVKAAWGKRAGQAGFNPAADVNGDKVIDIRDLSFVSRKLPLASQC